LIGRAKIVHEKPGLLKKRSVRFNIAPLVVPETTSAIFEINLQVKFHRANDLLELHHWEKHLDLYFSFAKFLHFQEAISLICCNLQLRDFFENKL
jgi:hypothetical protein